MLKSFISWLETHILRVGLIGIVDTVLGILAFGAVLSAVLGGPAVKAAAVVVAILVIICMFTVLIASRSRREFERARDRRLVARYCNVIQQTGGAPMHIVRWDDVTVIDAVGGVVETVTVCARVVAEQAHFFRFRIGPAWEQSEKQRAKVVCNVRSEPIDGMVGPRCDITQSWLADGRLEVLAHLASPVKAGSNLRIKLEISWPGMCEPLVKKRQPDDYLLKFGRGADHVRYLIVLPAGKEAYYEPIGFDAADDRYKVDVDRSEVGLFKVILIAREVPVRHRFGLRLELK
jgi:hypothetical protein